MIGLNFDDEKYIVEVLQKSTALEMATFIMKNRFSQVMPLMNETVQKMMHDSKPSLILFLNRESRVLTTFKSLVKEFPDLNIIYKNLNDNKFMSDAQKLMETLGIIKLDCPVLVFLPFTQPTNGIIPKYKTNKFSKKSMKQFIQDSLEGKLEVYLKSEQETSDPKRYYKQVTLNNFDEMISKDKFFLLGLDFFQDHTPQELKKMFNELGHSIQELQMENDIDVGVCDIYKNEISGKIEIKSIPQIVLIDQKDKDKRIYYDGKPEVADIRKFIEKHTQLAIGDYQMSEELKKKRLEEGVSSIMSGQDRDL